MVDFGELDDITVEVDEDYTPRRPTLPMTKPAPTVKLSEPYPARAALSLVEDPDSLFDFKDTSLTPVQQLYIISYAVKGTRMGACKLAGVRYADVQKWMDESEEFRNALQAAVDIARDALEEELLRRAMNGSDRLLLAAIKAAKPEKYQPKTTQSVHVHGEVVHSWAELAKEAAKVIDVPAKEVVVDGEYEDA